MKKTHIFFIGLLMTLGLAACESKRYNERIDIPEAKWDQSNKVNFDFAVDDTLNGYVFGIDLRHLENYRYSNLYVFMNTTWPNGNHSRDTIEITLAAPDGRWLGKGSGSMRDIRKVLIPNMRFPLKGNYHFEIEQAMREPVLNGIADIGLYIEKQ
ncbi:MAG: gliding motility lipoprotein GldH [Bacteroidales bacterium]|nr:gliding motility lipoprotein GldH [Bacteroidales bacterium]